LLSWAFGPLGLSLQRDPPEKHLPFQAPLPLLRRNDLSITPATSRRGLGPHWPGCPPPKRVPTRLAFRTDCFCDPLEESASRGLFFHLEIPAPLREPRTLSLRVTVLLLTGGRTTSIGPAASGGSVRFDHREQGVRGLLARSTVSAPATSGTATGSSTSPLPRLQSASWIENRCGPKTLSVDR
jgi:hypothetical protein